MMQMKIKKWGNSQGVRLPKLLLSQIGIDSPIDQTINVVVKNNSIVISKYTPQKPLKNKFSDVRMGEFNVDLSGECNWGPDVGAERVLR